MVNDMQQCELCGSPMEHFYVGKIRNGVWPNTVHSQVLKCVLCGVLRLIEKDCIQDYEGPGYRSLLEQPIEKRYELDDPYQLDRLQVMTTHYFRDKDLLDIGAGSGSFVDHVTGLVRSVDVVEPNREMSEILMQKSTVHGRVPVNTIYDIVTSFLVIEHLKDPCKHIEDCFWALEKGGQMWIQTPLYHKHVIQPQFFRTQHRWYFTEQTLTSTIMHSDIKLKGLRTFTMKRSFMDEEDIWAVITK